MEANSQGTQGIQADTSENNNFSKMHFEQNTEPNTAPEVTMANDPEIQMNALLNVRDNQFTTFLQGLYFSKKCSVFYASLLVLAVLMVCATLVQGIGIAKKPGFVFCEFLLNFAITVDFCFRLKLQGVKRFFFK